MLKLNIQVRLGKKKFTHKVRVFVFKGSWASGMNIIDSHIECFTGIRLVDLLTHPESGGVWFPIPHTAQLCFLTACTSPGNTLLRSMFSSFIFCICLPFCFYDSFVSFILITSFTKRLGKKNRSVLFSIVPY